MRVAGTEKNANVEFKENDKQMLQRLRQQSTILQKTKGNAKYQRTVTNFVDNIHEYTANEIKKLDDTNSDVSSTEFKSDEIYSEDMDTMTDTEREGGHDHLDDDAMLAQAERKQK